MCNERTISLWKLKENSYGRSGKQLSLQKYRSFCSFDCIEGGTKLLRNCRYLCNKGINSSWKLKENNLCNEMNC